MIEVIGYEQPMILLTFGEVTTSLLCYGLFLLIMFIILDKRKEEKDKATKQTWLCTLPTYKFTQYWFFQRDYEQFRKRK